MADSDIKDHRKPPAGVLPKNIQVIAVAALCVVVIALIFFSGGGGTKKKPDTDDGAKIADLEKQANEMADRIRREQANQRRLQQEALEAQRHFLEEQQNQPSMDQYGQIDELSQEGRKREANAPYSSSIAISYRSLPASSRSNSSEDSPPVPENTPSTPSSLRPDDLYASSSPAPSPSPSTPPELGPDVPRMRPGAKSYTLIEGTILDCVLLNRLDGEFSGPVSVMISTSVYSRTGKTLLVPIGSKLIGSSSRVDDRNQNRLAVSFHRLIMPDHFSVSLDLYPALSQVGETALKDQVNRHYWRVFGGSIAIGLLGGLASMGSDTGGYHGTSELEDFQRGVAGSMGQSGQASFKEWLNVMPTITIREGHRVKVFLTRDLQLPSYSDHMGGYS